MVGIWRLSGHCWRVVVGAGWCGFCWPVGAGIGWCLFCGWSGKCGPIGSDFLGVLVWASWPTYCVLGWPGVCVFFGVDVVGLSFCLVVADAYALASEGH